MDVLRMTALGVLALIGLVGFSVRGLEAQVTTAPVPGQPVSGLAAPEGYELAPGDVLSIYVQHSDAISGRTYPVDSLGYVTVPMLGRVQAQGRSLPSLELELTQKAAEFFVEPLVIVSLDQMRGLEVTLLGEGIETPGVYQVSGVRTLAEVLVEAGGVLPEAAQYLTLSRRADQGAIPHADAYWDETGRSVVNLPADDVVQLKAGSNLVVKPGDLVSLEQAEMVYVWVDGVVNGRIPLREGDGIYIRRALVMAGGVGPNSETDKATILREVADAPDQSEQIKVNVKKIMNAEEPDVKLVAGDILIIPSSGQPGLTEQMRSQGVGAVLNLLTWGLIY